MPCFILAMSGLIAEYLETVFLDSKGSHLIQHCLDQYQELIVVPAGSSAASEAGHNQQQASTSAGDNMAVNQLP